MRPALVLLMLTCLLTLMVAHRAYFLAHDQERLREKVKAALDDPAFANVEREHISMNHMDVLLEGFVATPEQRADAQQRVAAIRGVRCRDEDNHLRVPAHLSTQWNGDTLTLSGLLPNEASQREVVAWLTQSRPGLKVKTSGIRLDPSVAALDPPTTQPMPVFYSEVWNSIRAHASLRVERKDGTMTVTGLLPSAELRDKVLAALVPNAVPPLQSGGLDSGTYVKSASFTKPDALPAFLREFFASPGSNFFQADGSGITLRGMVTADAAARWHEMLAPLAEAGTVKAELQVFPSRYHFPNYVPESKLSPQIITALRQVLKQAVFHFEPNRFYFLDGETPRLNAATQAIAAAGREAHIIVGGYTEANGDPKAQQAAAWKRCETLVAEFRDRGLPPAQFEIVVYSPAAVPNGAEHHRVVELLLK
jgi:outer membrane protein OmpA-like peptidoglycan-associated protein